MSLAIQLLITNKISQLACPNGLSSQSRHEKSDVSFKSTETVNPSIWAKLGKYKTKITEFLLYGLGIFYLGLGGAIAFGGFDHGPVFNVIKGFLGVKPNIVAGVSAANGAGNIGLGVATHYYGEKANKFIGRQISKVFSGIKKMIFRR